MPSEIEQAFKKIVKKGRTTRSKGFTELLSFCQSNEISPFTELLRVPFLKIFTKFAVCAEKSSRCFAAELTCLFVSKMDVKTFLQPILNDILTLWLLTLFDPISEISSLQRKTLESVFPAGSKLKLLLEKYEQQVVSEICEFTKTEKFDRIKEICLTEMEGTSEEADALAELIKTEIVGLINLMHVSFMKVETDTLKSILFLNDKEIGSARRASLYRLAGKMKNVTWYEKQINLLLNKESSPSAFPAAFDFIGSSGNDCIKRETFALSVLGNAPVSELKKFSGLLLKFQVEESVDWMVRVCLNNNLMNRDRFLVFWRDVAGIVFNGFGPDSKSRALESLLFKTKSMNSSLCSFLPLNLEETMRCVEEVFSPDEIVEACRRGKFHPQAIYALSSIKSENFSDLLAELVSQMKLIDLQNKELMKIIPQELLTRRLCDSHEILSVPEIIRLIQSVNQPGAIEILERRSFSEWEKMLKSALLRRETVSKVLFELQSFREYAREHLNENSLVISCAFQSKISVFDERIFDQDHNDHVASVFNELIDFELECPLLKLCLENNFHLAESAPIRALNPEKKKLLYEYLQIEKDAELFDAIGCEDEEFYPIEFIENAIREKCQDFPEDLIEIVLFKPEVNKSDNSLYPLLLKLLEFPLKKFENQRIVCKCAVLCNSINLLNFEVSEKEFSDCEVADEFELFCLSKVLESSTNASEKFDVPCTFKAALLFYNHLRTVENANEILGNVIFNEENLNLYFLALGLSLTERGLIPVRSDNLSGLIDSLVCKERTCLLLFLSTHIEREEVKKEFWQVQFREKLKEILKYNNDNTPIESELKLRVAAGIWDKLTDPEIEILKDCEYESVLTSESFKLMKSYRFESVGLARLVLMTAPFLEHFALTSLKELYRAAVNPAMLLAFRGVYLQLHLDEQLVAAAYKLSESGEMGIDEIGAAIFPFYANFANKLNSQKFAVLLEMFLSAAEGSRDDTKLLSLFGDVFKVRLLPDLVKIVNNFHVFGTLESFNFTPRDFSPAELIQHVLFRACSLYPLLVCGFGGVPVEMCSDAQEILMQRELMRIRRQSRLNFDSVEISFKPSIGKTRKVINLRVRFMDEIELSIDLILPEAFPLQPIRVEGRERSGLADSKWKSSLLTLQVILRSPTTFSGNLIDAVNRWQANALKLFQGLEECAVCYSVLHASDKSLPGPACKQCKHKFHATCLYKWFKSSGNATCPLCRALF